MFKNILDDYQVSLQGKVLVDILQKILCHTENNSSWKLEKWLPSAQKGEMSSCMERNRGGTSVMLEILCLLI